MGRVTLLCGRLPKSLQFTTWRPLSRGLVWHAPMCNVRSIPALSGLGAYPLWASQSAGLVRIFFGQGVRVVSNIEESRSARNGLDRPGSAYVTGSASVVGCRDTGNVPGGACGRHSGNPSSNQASNREITAPVSCPIATFEPVNLLAIRQEDSLDISWFLWIEPVKGLGLTPTDIGAGGIEKGLDGPT